MFPVIEKRVAGKGIIFVLDQEADLKYAMTERIIKALPKTLDDLLGLPVEAALEIKYTVGSPMGLMAALGLFTLEPSPARFEARKFVEDANELHDDLFILTMIKDDVLYFGTAYTSKLDAQVNLPFNERCYFSTFVVGVNEYEAFIKIANEALAE